MTDPKEPVQLPIDGTLDLHAFRPRDVLDVFGDYLAAAHAAGLTEVRLIHGRGIGVQRAVVQRLLRGHPLVGDWWDAPRRTRPSGISPTKDSAKTWA